MSNNDQGMDEGKQFRADLEADKIKPENQERYEYIRQLAKSSAENLKAALAANPEVFNPHQVIADLKDANRRANLIIGNQAEELQGIIFNQKAETEKFRGENEDLRKRFFEAAEAHRVMTDRSVEKYHALKQCARALETCKFEEDLHGSCHTYEFDVGLVDKAMEAAKNLLEPDHIADKRGMVEEKGDV